jgi:hypothetical protein
MSHKCLLEFMPGFVIPNMWFYEIEQKSNNDILKLTFHIRDMSLLNQLEVEFVDIDNPDLVFGLEHWYSFCEKIKCYKYKDDTKLDTINKHINNKIENQVFVLKYSKLTQTLELICNDQIIDTNFIPVHKRFRIGISCDYKYACNSLSIVCEKEKNKYCYELIRLRNLFLNSRLKAKTKTKMDPLIWLCSRAPLWTLMRVCELIKVWCD